MEEIVGLTKEEVKKRIENGQKNTPPKSLTRTIPQILKDNIITLFNILNIVVALLILYTGTYRNLFFLFVIVTNTCIGIFQQIRAKNQLDKMALLTEAKYTVLRDGKREEIDQKEIVKDDVLYISRGEQLPVDVIFLENTMIEVDESQLTGEAKVVSKKKGDEILSGSIILSGKGLVKVLRVGDKSFISSLSAQIKQEKKESSELLNIINRIIQILTFIIIPLGTLFFVMNYRRTMDLNMSLLGTSAAVLGMIPEGLLLLTSVSLGVSAIKLSQNKVLVRSLPAIESLARVNVLCLDKTGTITSGNLKYKEFILFDQKYTEEESLNIVGDIIYTLNDDNETVIALKKKIIYSDKKIAVKSIPFSSARKWSGVEFANQETYFLGAPKFLLNKMSEDVETLVATYAQKGYRVLALASSNLPIRETQNEVELIGLIIIEDEIRADAVSTFKFFKKQGVEIKVISGDNPLTVSKIAQKAKIDNADKYINMQEINDNDNYQDLVLQNTVFGHVNPEQKKQLVKALQDNDNIVGMTGDGVNDILALQQADCSIGMASGSEAAKEISNFVLLKSNFNAMIDVLNEGRRVINNIERVASLYLIKTIYSVIMTTLLIFISMNYPYAPIQLSPVSLLMIGIPSFVLTLENNFQPIKQKFLQKVILNSLPAALCMVSGQVVLNYLSKIYHLSHNQLSTLNVLLMGFTCFLVLLIVSKPYKAWKVILLFGGLISFLMCFNIPILSSFFQLLSLGNLKLIQIYIPLLIMIIPFYFGVRYLFSILINKFFKNKNLRKNS